MAVPSLRADVALVITVAAILGVTVGVLLDQVIGGILVGAGTAMVFRFALRAINMQK